MSSDENSTSSKRTRASGEALDFLLQEFERNQNPSNEQRRDISDKTGMTEKAIRIWFQNRRAKLRKFERLSKINTNTTNTTNSSIHSSRSNSFSNLISPTYHNNGNHNNNNTNATLSQSFIPIEINEKYCFINCSSLSVGSWQRIKSGYHQENLLRNNLINLSPFTLNQVMANVDLLVILSKKNFEINYFFSAISNNSKILFRIFYPIDSILTCSLLDNNINKENNELRVSLSHQPKFSVYFFNGVNSNANQWSICDDFSEGQQVSHAYMNEGGTAIPHVLVGVKSSLQYLNAFILENNQIMHQAQQAQQAQQVQQQVQQQFDNPLIWDENNQDFQNQPQSQQILSLQHSQPPQQNFSPLGNYDANQSPNSVTSHTNMHINSNPNNNSNNNIIHSSVTTPHSASSNRVYPTSNPLSNNSQTFHNHHPSNNTNIHDTTNPNTNGVSNHDNFDIFHSANTPDFFINTQNEMVNTPGSNMGGINGPNGTGPLNPVMYSNNNSPSLNNLPTATSNSSNIHAYTHHQYPNNDPLLETLSNGSNHTNNNLNGPNHTSHHLHQPSNHEFDFIGLHNDFNTPSSSNNNTPGLGFETTITTGPIGGGNTNNDTNNSNTGTGSNGNTGNNGASNIDHFIDYGSQFS
ncbi:hypothetical protein DFJ63DRAFT_163066 [Scheffersomyces coipomensis]|uniref:uncharacterized protein n=1 Tax=Scheffersomyces coipomensis TaxID=1788519 RepID=UPI00315C9E0D